MHKKQFLSSLENAVYDDIDELNTDQMRLCSNIILLLDDKIPERTDITADQHTSILDMVKTLLIYNERCSQEKWQEFSIKIDKVLSNSSQITTSIIPAYSLLAALYYINDIIAGSSAMGRGSEESIIPSAEHGAVLVAMLESIYSTETPSEIAVFINTCRHIKKGEAHRKLVPLLFDIVETTYASLLAWRVLNIRKKQAEVDLFYHEAAESCMAKGVLNILKALQDLPADFLQILSGQIIDKRIAEKLQKCSQQSMIEIQDTNVSRRYRSGNSGAVWLDIRSRGIIEEDSKQIPEAGLEESLSLKRY